ncbi:hypothetical protein PQB34_gp37 [Ochrobactrum phage POI1126]|uniref:Uncharacterized protein n=1 Tax=Ochrobactrum phage POI1126 TaxID=1932118 RepID=A0A240F4T9_9CAUD|nr:hypothetical protein PQB34_gp37 [Ochrobactrum phage POI1126]APU92965.1 hypothetical protein POI1126_37 [Ochrobactrum phage POI1126]
MNVDPTNGSVWPFDPVSCDYVSLSVDTLTGISAEIGLCL